MSILHDFGARVRELRLKAGMSQDILATRSGLNRSYIGGVERGERNLSLTSVEKIANALDVDLGYFFEDERFVDQSAHIKRELRKPLEDRFLYEVDVEQQVVSWKVMGVLGVQDVKLICQKLKRAISSLTKGHVKILVDNREMVSVDGDPFVFKPEVTELWEELQLWMLPYCAKVVVLCNSKLMKNQMERLGKRSGLISCLVNIYEEDADQCVLEAYRQLDIHSNRLVDGKIQQVNVVCQE